MKPETKQEHPDTIRLNWIIAHSTNIDWFQFQHGDDLRAFVDSKLGSAGGIDIEDAR